MKGMRSSALVVVLVLFVAICACNSASARTVSSGLYGRILLSPICPVERFPPQRACAPRPLIATLRLTRLSGKRVSVRVRSGANGRFRVRLDPGTYIVRALRLGDSPFPRPPFPRRVQILPGHFTAMTVTYDTGIR